MKPAVGMAGVLATVGWGTASHALAQAQAWRITPSITLHATLTDNVNLAPDANKQSDFITQVVPGLRIDGASARARLNLDYRMSNLFYARDSRRDHTQHYLNGRGTLEAIQNWLYVDAQANITQHAVSAFGAQPITPELDTNRARTSYYQVSPFVRGQLAGVANYELRYRWSTSNSAAGRFVNTETTEAIGTLASAQDRLLSWGLSASQLNVRYDTGRNVDATRLRGTLGYRWDVDWRFYGILGHESNNYATFDRQSRVTYGGGVDWTPSERTQVSGVWERRFFGDGHNLVVRHRTARTAWQFTDSKSEDILNNQFAFAGAGTAFDLLFEALAATIPDPVQRSLEVERILAQTGLPPDLALRVGFLTNRVFLNRMRQASVALLGVNNTVTLAAYVSDRQALGPAVGTTVDDFVLSRNIEQRGLSANWSRRISEFSSFNMLLTHVRSRGARGTGLESAHSVGRVSLSHRLGVRTIGSIGARVSHVERPNTPDATERALTASLTMTF